MLTSNPNRKNKFNVLEYQLDTEAAECLRLNSNFSFESEVQQLYLSREVVFALHLVHLWSAEEYDIDGLRETAHEAAEA